jgi:hypothetical protein
LVDPPSFTTARQGVEGQINRGTSNIESKGAGVAAVTPYLKSRLRAEGSRLKFLPQFTIETEVFAYLSPNVFRGTKNVDWLDFQIVREF